MMVQVQKYGGYGVDIKLQTRFSPGPSVVFWTKMGNSYVVVENERGVFSVNGCRVDLASINGIGEVRWVATKYLREDEKEAFDHFHLSPVLGE